MGETYESPVSNGLRNRLLCRGFVLVFGLLAGVAWSQTLPTDFGSVVEFHSFINTGYQHLPKLRGWETTRDLIGATLAISTGEHLADGTPEELGQFLSRLRPPAPDRVQVIYLASQQNADGSWVFTNREEASWDELLKRAHSCGKEDGLRIVLMVSCYARKTSTTTRWEPWAPLTLFACAEREVTWEIDFDKRQPRDFRLRLASGWAWLEGRYRGRSWNHRVSFMGAIWIESWLAKPVRSSERGEWLCFLQRAIVQAEAFRKKHGDEFASTLSIKERCD